MQRPRPSTPSVRCLEFHSPHAQAILCSIIISSSDCVFKVNPSSIPLCDRSKTSMRCLPARYSSSDILQRFTLSPTAVVHYTIARCSNLCSRCWIGLQSSASILSNFMNRESPLRSMLPYARERFVSMIASSTAWRSIKDSSCRLSGLLTNTSDSPACLGRSCWLLPPSMLLRGVLFNWYCFGHATTVFCARFCTRASMQCDYGERNPVMRPSLRHCK